MSRLKSSKPSKQRKKIRSALPSITRKLVSAHLLEDLRKKYNARTLPVRTGDSVKVLRGDFSGVEGKVSQVDRRRGYVYIDGITRENVSGQTVKSPIHTSNVMITRLNLDDKWRSRSISRKGTVGGSDKEAS